MTVKIGKWPCSSKELIEMAHQDWENRESWRSEPHSKVSWISGWITGYLTMKEGEIDEG